MKDWSWLLILLVIVPSGVLCLTCMQCDMNGEWYSEEAHEKHVTKCQMGLMEPQICTNRSHTHCVVSWFRSGGRERTVTERKCGTIEDVNGCTLYNSKISRKVRHLLNKDNEEPRETASLFVEVCSESCPLGDCVNSTPLLRPFIISVVLAIVCRLL